VTGCTPSMNRWEFWMLTCRWVRVLLWITIFDGKIKPIMTWHCYSNKPRPGEATESLLMPDVVFGALQHVWSLGLRSTSVVCHGWCNMTSAGWLFLRGCTTSSLWRSIVVFSTGLQDISLTTVPASEVPSGQHHPSVRRHQLCVFATTRLEAMFFQSPDQQSGIHCQMICKVQLLTPNSFCGSRRHLFARH